MLSVFKITEYALATGLLITIDHIETVIFVKLYFSVKFIFHYSTHKNGKSNL